MKEYIIDVPAYVTLRVAAESEAQAAKIVKEQCDFIFHNFAPRSADYDDTEVEGVAVSLAITIYGNPQDEKVGPWECSSPEEAGS